MNTGENIAYNINVAGDGPNTEEYEGKIPRYNKDGTDIELGNLTEDIKEYIEKYIEGENDDNERKEYLFAILSLHYLNKVIVIGGFQFSGRQLIDTGKEFQTDGKTKKDKKNKKNKEDKDIYAIL